MSLGKIPPPPTTVAPRRSVDGDEDVKRLAQRPVGVLALPAVRIPALCGKRRHGARAVACSPIEEDLDTRLIAELLAHVVDEGGRLARHDEQVPWHRRRNVQRRCQALALSSFHSLRPRGRRSAPNMTNPPTVRSGRG